jgi:hypothetical protein
MAVPIPIKSIFGSIILIESSFRKLEGLSSPMMQYQGFQCNKNSSFVLAGRNSHQEGYGPI